MDKKQFSHTRSVIQKKCRISRQPTCKNRCISKSHSTHNVNVAAFLYFRFRLRIFWVSRIFYISHFPPLLFCAAFSCLAFSCLAFSVAPFPVHVNGSLDPHEWVPQTVSRSVQPFCTAQPYALNTDSATSVATGRICAMHAMRPNNNNNHNNYWLEIINN